MRVRRAECSADGTAGRLGGFLSLFWKRRGTPDGDRANRQECGVGTEHAGPLARHCLPTAMSALSAARLNPTSLFLRLGVLSAAALSLMLF